MPSNRRNDSSRFPAGVSENEHMDTERTVMRNLKGFVALEQLQRAEEDALVNAYHTLLLEVRSDTPMSVDLLKHIHSFIFGDIYDWAGRFRTITISKPGVTWPPPEYLDRAMMDFERNVLKAYPASHLLQVDNDELCKALAHIQGEFLAIHPFREGNARTIKVFTDLLTAQARRPLLRYDMSPTGQKQYLAAEKAVLTKQDYRLMETVIREALVTFMTPL